MNWWPQNWFEKQEKKTEPPPIYKREVLLPPYYFSIEAQKYRAEIDELKRQLENSKECEKRANQFAQDALKKYTVNGESVRKLSYARGMVRKLSEVLDQ